MENLDLYPWAISLDKEKTIEYYINNDLSEDKSLNLALKKQLDSETLNFIERFGVDIKKASVRFIPSIFDEDDVGILYCYIQYWITIAIKNLIIDHKKNCL